MSAASGPALRRGSRSDALRVVDVGRATTIQDHGRCGLAHLGVPTAGAVDRTAHDLVNRLVGNSVDAATIETLGGMTLEAVRPTVVARSTDGSRHTLATGARLRVEPAPGRVWAYLAVRGGIDIDPVLGSRSHDTLSGLGPSPVTDGVILRAGTDPRTELDTELAPDRHVDRAVRVWSGPHEGWFVGGRSVLTRRAWTVSSDSSRVGVRLVAAAIDRTSSAETSVASFGLVEGAIQITPSGEPIVMMSNHPTTGGYPVIAVVDPFDVGYVAQSAPGTSLRFVNAD